MWQSFLIELTIALLKIVGAQIGLKGNEIYYIEMKLRAAKEYQKVVNDPDADREDRRHAEDDYFS